MRKARPKFERTPRVFVVVLVVVIDALRSMFIEQGH
jgi:hypothetical protein